jgi:hypothetical protein
MNLREKPSYPHTRSPGINIPTMSAAAAEHQCDRNYYSRSPVKNKVVSITI